MTRDRHNPTGSFGSPTGAGFARALVSRVRAACLVLLGRRPAEVRFDAADAAVAEEVAGHAAYAVAGYLTRSEDLGRVDDPDEDRLYDAAKLASLIAIGRYASFDAAAAESPDEQGRRCRRESALVRMKLGRYRKPRLYRPDREETEVGDGGCA